MPAEREKRAVPAPPPVTLPPELAADVHRMNPCWQGRPLPVLPPARRHIVAQSTLMLLR